MDYEALASARAEISSLNDELTVAYQRLDELTALLAEAQHLLGSAKAIKPATNRKENFAVSGGGSLDLYMRIKAVLA